MINPISIDSIYYDKSTIKELVRYLKCAYDSCLSEHDYESAKRFKHIGLLLVNYGMNIQGKRGKCSLQECLMWFNSAENNLNYSGTKDIAFGNPIYEKEGAKFFKESDNTYYLDEGINKWINIITGKEYPN